MVVFLLRSNDALDLPLSFRILPNFVAILIFIPLMLELNYYYAKIKANLRPIARIGLLILNMALLILYVIGAEAIIKMVQI
jgi:hypothetical protein